MTVRIGLEVLQSEDFRALAGKRVALLANPAAVDQSLVSTYDIFRQATEVQLRALFSPEHGFNAASLDGESVTSSIDPISKLPVYSLYGEYFRPTREMLNDVDVVVCDIQDIGSRFYTYMWTVSYILEAAGEYDVGVIILDRPNPLGDRVEGASLDPKFASFVGRYPVPIRHGMTPGELAQMFNTLWTEHPASLTVIPCQNYFASMLWEETGRIFVPTSPAMPHPTTAQHYPGACLVEGTTLSEGRGTALPFEIVGAPHLDAQKLAVRLNQFNLPGVCFRPHVFTPSASKYAGSMCVGIQVHITSIPDFRPVETWMQVLRTIYLDYGFEWRDAAFDRLAGTDRLRLQITSGEPLTDLLQEWVQSALNFQEQSQPFWLYPRLENTGG